MAPQHPKCPPQRANNHSPPLHLPTQHDCHVRHPSPPRHSPARLPHPLPFTTKNLLPGLITVCPSPLKPRSKTSFSGHPLGRICRAVPTAQTTAPSPPLLSPRHHNHFDLVVVVPVLGLATKVQAVLAHLGGLSISKIGLQVSLEKWQICLTHFQKNGNPN